MTIVMGGSFNKRDEYKGAQLANDSARAFLATWRLREIGGC